MEELLAVLIGAGALALSPLLLPGLRPVAKSAVKSGMAVADAAKGVAAATSQGLHQVVHRAGGKEIPAEPANLTQPELPPAVIVETPAAAPGPAPAASQPAVDLRPMVKAAVKGGQTLAGAALGAVAGVGKQWGELIADASAELKGAGAPRAPAEPAEVAAPTQAAAEVSASYVETPVAESPIVETPVVATPVVETPVKAPVVTPIETPVETPVDAPVQAPTETPGQAPILQAAPPQATSVTEPGPATGPDDLRLIQGIGPKVAAILQASGITTFAQLAGTDVDKLQEILTQAGPRYRLINPTAWPEEARQRMVAGS